LADAQDAPQWLDTEAGSVPEGASTIFAAIIVTQIPAWDTTG
jgi:hypothetical protein